MDKLLYLFELIQSSIDKPCRVSFFTSTPDSIELVVRCDVNNKEYAKRIVLLKREILSMTNPEQVIRTFCRVYNRDILDL